VDALRVLVVDDERPARAKVARLLAADTRFVLVGEASQGFEALEQIEALQPDVLFLDVQMPGLDGFRVLEAVGERPGFAVVFSTAFDQHALAAFEAHATDYLLKPYAGERFQRTLDRVYAQCLGERLDHGQLLRTVSQKPRDRLVVRLVSGEWTSLAMTDISLVVAARKHTQICCEARDLLVRKAFSEVIKRLDDRFVRTHRSEVVRVDAVLRVEPWAHGDLILHLKDGSTRVLTRTFRAAFMEKFGNTLG
jgi:two-component system LytT family response regulator